MANPKVSIIIATYNSAKTLSVALDSVVNQTFQDWECIIVDGASKDDTVSIVKEYAANDGRIRYVSEPDNGIYDAFNKGWKMAKGEWIHYLGSDDVLTKESFLDLIKTSNCNYDVITGDCYIIKTDGTIKPNISKYFYGCHQGKIVRKSIMEKMNGFDERYKILADKDLMVRMERSNVSVINIRTFVAYFSMAGVSQSLSGTYLRSKELYDILKNNNVYKYPSFYVLKNYLMTILTILYRKLLLTIIKSK